MLVGDFMFSYDGVINYCKDYMIKNGVVIDKKSGKAVLDEETVLRVKSAVLIYTEARNLYLEAKENSRSFTGSEEKFINNTMTRFGVNGEENSYGVNKLIKGLLDSNGHYEENLPSDDLKDSKFSIFYSKRDWALSYLRLKFREKGFDIDNFKIKLDTSHLKADGYSVVIIDFDVKKLNKKRNVESEIDWESSSVSDKIRFVSLKMEEAKLNNDDVDYNFWEANLEKIKGETKKDCNYFFNELVSSIKSYYSMKDISDDAKKVYIGDIFYNETNLVDLVKSMDDFKNIKDRVSNELGDDSVSRRLRDIILGELSVKYKELYPSEDKKKSSSGLDLSDFIGELMGRLNQIKDDYHEMMSDGVLSIDEKESLLDKFKGVLDDGYTLRDIATSMNDKEKLNVIIQSVNEEVSKLKKGKDNSELKM